MENYVEWEGLKGMWYRIQVYKGESCESIDVHGVTNARDKYKEIVKEHKGKGDFKVELETISNVANGKTIGHTVEEFTGK